MVTNSTVPLNVSAAGLIGQRLAVLGMSGSGKSHTVKYLIEVLSGAEQGIPMSVLDIEGEYWPLRSMGFVIVGEPGDPHADLHVAVDQVWKLARFSVSQGVSVVLSMAHLNRKAVAEYAEAYLSYLWDQQRQTQQPYFVIVEEAQEFVPQSKSSPVADLLTTIFKRGRKYGMGAILASQRSTAVDKDVLTQAGILILHRVLHPADLSVYKELIPLDKKEIPERVRKLKVGQAAIVKEGDYLGVAQIPIARLFEAATSPGSTPSQLPGMRAVDETVLRELRALLVAAPETKADPEKEAMQKQITDLEVENADLKRQLEDLRAENEHLKITPGSTAAIARMDVENIHAASIIAPGGLPDSAPAGTLSPISEQLMVDAEKRRQGMQDQVLRREQRDFDRLLHNIRQTTGMWRSVYAYLLDREGQSFSIRELGRLLAYNPTTLYKSQPMVLLTEKLLSRQGRSESTFYRSRTQELLRDRFPNSDPAELLNRILKVVTPK